MFNKLITLDLEDMKNIISNKNNKVNSLTYKELIDDLKNYITLKDIKSIIGISDSTHSRLLNNHVELNQSMRIHLYMLLQTIKL